MHLKVLKMSRFCECFDFWKGHVRKENQRYESSCQKVGGARPLVLSTAKPMLRGLRFAKPNKDYSGNVPCWCPSQQTRPNNLSSHEDHDIAVLGEKPLCCQDKNVRKVSTSESRVIGLQRPEPALARWAPNFVRLRHTTEEFGRVPLCKTAQYTITWWKFIPQNKMISPRARVL